MPSLTEARAAGGFLVSEGNGSISRENAILAASQTIVAGHVLGQVDDGADWTVDTAYSLADRANPTTSNGRMYECTTAGTSHASTEPTWPLTLGATVADGTAVWTCVEAQYVEHNAGASDGSQAAKAIAYAGNITGAGETRQITIMARLAEVNLDELTWKTAATAAQKTAGLANLATYDIHAR